MDRKNAIGRLRNSDVGQLDWLMDRQQYECQEAGSVKRRGEIVES